MRVIIGLILSLIIFCQPVAAENYSKEYLSIYIGRVVTVNFINDLKEFNRVTLKVNSIDSENKLVLKGKNFENSVQYFLVGDSDISYKIKININKIIYIE